MPRPGTDIRLLDGAGPSGPALATGTAFAVGLAGQANVGAIGVTSLAEYETNVGPRSAGAPLYDAARAFFLEGGALFYVSRIAGASLAATGVLDAALTLTARAPGTAGNGLSISVADDPSRSTGDYIAGDVEGTTVPEVLTWVSSEPTKEGDRAVIARTVELASATPRQTLIDALDAIIAEHPATVDRYRLEVRRATQLVEVSPWFDDASDPLGWQSGFVQVAAATGTLQMPTRGASVALTGGTDSVTVDADTVAVALGAFSYGLGPGQVLAPGLSDTLIHWAVLAHCESTFRVALLDAPDTTVEAELDGAVAALYQAPGARLGSLWGPALLYPAAADGATQRLPGAAVEAGIIARADRQGNPNQPAAGQNGVTSVALGLAEDFTDAQREALNAAGLNLFKVKYGSVRAYGYRTVAGPDETNWRWFANSRVLMAIAHEADAIAETYVLRQIDGQGQLFSALNSDLRGVLLRYFTLGALYGTKPEEAFDVDTGPVVNTTTTIANGEVHAVLRVKASPSAEWVRIDIAKTPMDQALAA